MAADAGALVPPQRGPMANHGVKFYKADAEVAAVASKHVSAALSRDAVALVMATREHRPLLCERLTAAGVSAEPAVAKGRLVFQDAADMLARLLVGGRLSRSSFDEVVGDRLRRSADDGNELFVFGEMVGLLWDARDVSNVIELEQMWDELTDELPLVVLHAYSLPNDAEIADFVDDLCLLHSQVLTDAPTPEAAQVSRWFPATDASPAAARRFVTQMLTGWDCRSLIEDSRLVVDELATNALRHAGSDFTVSLSRLANGVEMAVGDCSTDPPVPSVSGLLAPGGRGLHLVAASASRWGHRLSGDGKLVWAQVIASDGSTTG